jgi:tetratricopeptide (TPR) repeat protein
VALLIIAGVSMRWAVTPAGQSAPNASAETPVLIGGFEDATGTPNLGQSISYALEGELGASKNIRALSRARVDDTLRLMMRPMDTVLDATTAREICIRDGGVTTFIIGRIERSGSALVVRASITDAVTGSLERLSVTADTAAALPAAIRSLADRIRAALNDASRESPHEQLEPVTTPSLDALRLYSESNRLGARPEWAAARELAKRAVDIDPEFPAARIWLAWCLFNSNAPASDYRLVAAEALKLADRASTWERHWIEGSYHAMHGDLDSAVKSYEATLRLRPDHYWASGNLAINYGRLGRFEKAAPVALRLAESRPNDYRALNIAFIALRRAGRLDEAARFAKRMRVIDEREQRYMLADAWLFDAAVAWIGGDASRTASELDQIFNRVRVLSDAAKSAILPDVALMYLALRRPADARRIVDTLPNGPDKHLHASIAALHSGDRGTARALASIGEFSRSASEPWDRVWVLARSGAVAEAAELVALARKTTPAVGLIEGSLVRAERLDAAAAEVAFARGDLPSTIMLLEGALPGLMADVTVRPAQMYRAAETLADALTASGNTQQAVEVLEAALAQRHRLTFSGAPLWSSRCALKVERLTGHSAGAASTSGAVPEITTKSIRASRLYRSAVELMQGAPPRDSVAAEKLLREAIADDPEFASGHAALAVALRDQNRTATDVLAAARRAVSLANNLTGEERLYIDAIGAYLQAVYSVDDSGFVQGNERAAALLEQLVASQPRHAGANDHLAAAYTNLRRDEDMLRATVRRAAAFPDSVIRQSWAAIEYTRAGQFEKAAPFVSRATSLGAAKPDSENAFHTAWLALLPAQRFWLENRPQDALRVIDEVALTLRAVPERAKVTYWRQLFAGYLAVGRLRHAARIARSAATQAERDNMALTVLTERGDRSGIRNFLEARPGVIADENFLWLPIPSDLIGEALERLDREQPPTMVGANAHLLVAGRLALLAGRTDDAIALLQRAHLRRPERGIGRSMWINILLSDAWLAKGDTSAAIRALETATQPRSATTYGASTGPMWIRARWRLAEIYRNAGELVKAIAIERQLTTLLAVADTDHPILVALQKVNHGLAAK